MRGKTRGCGRQYTITGEKKIASVCDCSKTAESSLETKAMKKRKKTKKHKINKNEATLKERIVLIFRILIQIF